MKKLLEVFLLGIFIFLTINMQSVSAQTTLFIDSDFDSEYRLAEVVKFDFRIKNSGEDVSDYISVYVECDSDSDLIYKRYIFLQNETKDFEFDVPLIEEGLCRFEVEFDKEIKKSESFRVSNDLEIENYIKKKYIKPGENVTVIGNITTFRGDAYKGTGSVRFDEEIEKSFETDDGEFRVSYKTDKDISPGTYNIEIIALKEDSKENQIYYGEASNSFYVKKSATDILIEGSDLVKPPKQENFEIKIVDQLGDIMKNKSIIVNLYDSENNLFEQKEIKNSSGNFSYSFDYSFPDETAIIRAYYGGIEGVKEISIQGSPKIEVYLTSDEKKLIFENIGNSLYNNNINLNYSKGNFTSENFPLALSLESGEKEIINLSEKINKTGNYTIRTSLGHEFEIEISEEDNETPTSITSTGKGITGAAVSLPQKIKENLVISVLIFLIVLFIVIGIIFRKKIRNFIDKKLGASLEPEKGYEKAPNTRNKKGFIDKIKNFLGIKEKNKEKESFMNEKAIKEKKNTVQEFDLKKSAGISEKEDSDKQEYIIIMIKSEAGIENYEEEIHSKGFELKKINNNLGYFLFPNQEGKALRKKVFEFVNELKENSKHKSDNMTLILNNGIIEKNIKLIKNFVKVHRKIMDHFPGKIIIGEKMYLNLKTEKEFIQKEIEINEKKIKVRIR